MLSAAIDFRHAAVRNPGKPLPDYGRGCRGSGIPENAPWGVAEGPLSAVTTDAYPFPSLVRSAPIPDIILIATHAIEFDPELHASDDNDGP